VKESRTIHPRAGEDLPVSRALPLVDLLVDTQTELLDLPVRSLAWSSRHIRFRDRIEGF